MKRETLSQVEKQRQEYSEAVVGVSREAIQDCLAQEGIDPSLVLSLQQRMSSGTEGILIYGSRARGDFTPTSDYDFLRLSRLPMSTFRVGPASVSSYTYHQLLSASETLFGTHLKRDSRIILDPKGLLNSALEAIKPADPRNLIETVSYYSIVLNQPPQEQRRHLAGLTRLARYLLRTAIYARAMLEGRPCFSVRELAVRFKDPQLSALLASDPVQTGPPSPSLFEELITRLIVEIGPLRENSAMTLDELAMSQWDSDRTISALAIRSAREDGVELDYSDLPKVLL